MLHPGLDPLRLRDEFAQRGRMQIRPFLQEHAADALHDCLQQQVPWTLAFRRDGRSQTLPRDAYAAMDEGQRQQLLQALYAESRGRYGFAYESYMMVKAYLEKADLELMLHRVLEYLNSAEFLGFARTLSGLHEIRRVSAQATRYRIGHYLRRHNDFDAEEGRLVAYVINLTPSWNVDWGGQLQFVGEDETITETFFPHWNSLSLFRVPQQHSVSGVMPFAEGDRLAITGWFQS